MTAERKKKETIEEFLARGGAINKIAPQESREEKTIMSCSSAQHPHLASLTDGVMFFTEKTKSRKKNGTKRFLDKLEKSNLPEEVIQRLKKAVTT